MGAMEPGATSTAQRPSAWARVRQLLTPRARLAETVAYTPAEMRARQETPRRPPKGATGVSGTRIYSGRISEERHPELAGTAWAQAAMDMLRTDPVIAAGWTALRQTLLSAEWAFEPLPGGSREIADWLDDALGTGGRSGRMVESFEAALARILVYHPVGFRYVEPVWRVDDDGVRVERLADRVPVAHWRWVTDAAGRLVEVIQVPPAGSERIATVRTSYRIPANKLLLFTHQGEGVNFEGVGSLRPVWWLWKLKRDVLDIAAIGWERWAVGTPIAEYDPAELQASAQELAGLGFESAGVADIIERLETSLQRYVSHESSWLSVVRGIKLTTLGGDGRAFDVGAAVALVEHLNQEMLITLLVQFLLLGVNNTGARAVGDTHLDFFRASALNVLDHIAGVIGGAAAPGAGLAGRLLDWNFPGLAPTDRPRLRHQGVDAGRLIGVLGDLAGGVGAGLLTPTDDVESAIRRDAKLDALPESARRSPGTRRATADPVGDLLAKARRRTEEEI